MSKRTAVGCDCRDAGVNAADTNFINMLRERLQIIADNGTGLNNLRKTVLLFNTYVNAPTPTPTSCDCHCHAKRQRLA